MLGILFVSFLLLWFFLRLSRGITRSASCLIGKTAIVTGANSGIGYQVVLNLASRGCRVIMADVADMEESKRKVIKYTNNANIVAKKLDLSSFNSVREFASDILENEERLDILVNNAGIFSSGEKTTTDGLNPVMQINYFGHFLLTHLLIELLKKSAPSRIVFLSSIAAFWSSLTLDKLKSDLRSSSYAATCELYCNSKFAVLAASDIFAEKLEGTGVTSNSVHPGFVWSPMQKSMYSSLGPIFGFSAMGIYVLSPKDTWQGSQTPVHVAVSRKLENTTGKHFWDCKPHFKPLKAYDRNFCQKMWEISSELVGLKPEEKL